MSTEIFKISYFSFTLKLNAKKKLPLKISDLERRGCKKIFAGGGVMFHKGGWGGRGLARREWFKNFGMGCDHALQLC